MWNKTIAIIQSTNPTYKLFANSLSTRYFPLENNTINSWSQISLILSKFTLSPSTYKTFAMLGNPGKKMIHFPFIWDLLSSPKVTLPPFFGSNILKREQSLVICLEQPLSKYHKQVSIIFRAVRIIKHTSCLAWSYDRVLSLYPLLNNFNRALAFLLPKTLHKNLLRQSSLLWSLHFSIINYSITSSDFNKSSLYKSFSNKYQAYVS